MQQLEPPVAPGGGRRDTSCVDVVSPKDARLEITGGASSGPSEKEDSRAEGHHPGSTLRTEGMEPQPGGLRGVVSAVEMALVLSAAVSSVSPAESPADRVRGGSGPLLARS